MARATGRWVPWLVGGLMAVVLAANAILIYLAISDPSFAVEPDSYRKALLWDEKRAQDARNLELGWRLEVEVAGAEVRLRLADAAGIPIEDARVQLEAFHGARAAEILRADLAHGAGADYVAALPLARPGLWEFRILVSRGVERFTRTSTVELGRR